MGFAGPTRVFCMCLLLAALLLCSAPISSTLSENGEMRLEMESGRRCLKVNIDDYSEPGANPRHDPPPPTKQAKHQKLA